MTPFQRHNVVKRVRGSVTRKRVLELWLQDKTGQEIAEELGLDLSSVYRAQHRAIRDLRESNDELAKKHVDIQMEEIADDKAQAQRIVDAFADAAHGGDEKAARTVLGAIATLTALRDQQAKLLQLYVASSKSVEDAMLDEFARAQGGTAEAAAKLEELAGRLRSKLAGESVVVSALPAGEVDGEEGGSAA